MKITKLISLLVILAASNGLLAAKKATDFLLKNGSSFDVFVRCRSNEEAAAGMNFDCQNTTLPPGTVAKFSGLRKYSIITAGTSKLISVSRYYDVPTPDALANKLSTKNKDEYDSAIRQDAIPLITISSGVSYGWNFNLSYVHTKVKNS